MSEYICEKHTCHSPDGLEAYSWVEREKVVRCRDCAYYTAVDTIHLVGERHPRLRMGCVRQHETCKPDEFCSWGVRREEL